MKLYYAPGTRADKCRWALEEAGVPYELVPIDMKKGEHKGAEYRKVHPLGLIPALQDGDQTILESGAICLYVAERGLAPATDGRGAYYQWIFFVQATLDPLVFQFFRHTKLLPEDKRSAEVVEESRQGIKNALALVEDNLRQGPFLLGEQFSAADVLMGSMLSWSEGMGLLEGFPKCLDYVARLRARPARQKAFAALTS